MGLHHLASALTTALLVLMSTANAGGAGISCAQMAGLQDGAFLVTQSDSHIVGWARVGPGVPAVTSHAVAKGALARHLGGELGTTVRWSGAVHRGPFACDGFQLVQVIVDPLTVRLVEVAPTTTR